MAISAGGARFVRRLQRDPVHFQSKILGRELWGIQRDISMATVRHRTVSVASCHAAGKSYAAAGIALAFGASYSKSLVVTTAPTDRQVRKILWKEIRAAYRGARYKLGGRILTQELIFEPDWSMYGFTAPDYDPDRFVGLHAPHVMVIADEASGISDEIFTGMKGLTTSGHARRLLIGNPTNPNGEFANAHRAGKLGESSFTISAFDTPNLTAFGITLPDIRSGNWVDKIAAVAGFNPDKLNAEDLEMEILAALPMPGLVSPVWIREVWEDWGEDDPRWIAKVLGIFPDGGEAQLYPNSWVEAAKERTIKPHRLDPTILGADIARMGGDESAVYAQRGGVVRRVWTGFKLKTTETTGHIIVCYREAKASWVWVDAIGIGAGVFDMLAETTGIQAREFIANTTQGVESDYMDLRAQSHWLLRKRFEAGTIDLDPADKELAAQLVNIRWKVNRRGKIQVESKDEMKARGLKSPDRLDAITMAFADDGGPLSMLEALTK